MRTGFRRYGLYDLLNGFKEAGSPLSLSLENMAIACLCESRSNIRFNLAGDKGHVIMDNVAKVQPPHRWGPFGDSHA